MVKKRKSVLATISLGFVLVVIQIWLLTQADLFFPQDTDAWRSRLIIYTLMTAFVFSFDSLSSRNTERSLFKVSFLTKLPVYLLSAGITFGVLYLFGLSIPGKQFPGIIQGIASVPLGIILLHAFIVSINEELTFRGFMVNELRARQTPEVYVKGIQATLFALFHVAMAGGELLLVLPYIPLGLGWLYIRDKYSPKTNMANAGSHFAWNLFILGFLR